MFVEADLRRVLDLQERAYALFQWMGTAIEKGFISFGAAQAHASDTDAARVWMRRHYEDLPSHARPAVEDMDDFMGLFNSFLKTSLTLVEEPERRLYSPHAHCFCPWCSWWADIPRIQPKRLSTADKRKAEKMMGVFLEGLAEKKGVGLNPVLTKDFLQDARLRERLAICTYGAELFRRMRGDSSGPAGLALWRMFAWLPTGSPRKGFKLTAPLVLEAEGWICAHLSGG